MDSKSDNSVCEMELDIWQGDMGLPSVDPQCLAVMVRIEYLPCA